MSYIGVAIMGGRQLKVLLAQPLLFAITKKRGRCGVWFAGGYIGGWFLLGLAIGLIRELT